MLPFRSRRHPARLLSAHVDGELDDADTERLAAHLALDARSRAQLTQLRAVDDLVRDSLTPPSAPDAGAAAAAIVAALPSTPAVASTGVRWTPVAVAAGLLLTAGLAVAGYRHRRTT